MASQHAMGGTYAISLSCRGVGAVLYRDVLGSG